MSRRGWILVPLALASAPLALRADEGTSAQRLAALASELKNPDGFRAVYKLVDSGPGAVPILVSKLGSSPLSDERIELCLRELARTKEGARAEITTLAMALQPLTRARLARALAGAKAVDAIYPIVDALDSTQEPLEVVVYGPHGTKALDSSKVAKPVTQACASFGDKAAAAIRTRLAKTGSTVFRIEAANVLGQVKIPAFAPDLVKLASDEARSSDERAAAIAALAEMKSPAARSVFAVALASDDAGLRAAGARGLAAVPDPSAVPALARIVEEDTVEDVRLEAIRALSGLEDPLALAPLRTALAAAPKLGENMRFQVITACAQGIAASGDRAGMMDMVHVLDGNFGFPSDRAVARALARIPGLEYEPRDRLRALAEDAKFSAIPRACACWVLACRGEDASLVTLLALGDDKDPAVRTAVALLLQEGKLDGAIPKLEKLAADPNEKVRRAAVLSLGKSEASIAGAAVARAKRHLDPDPVVRKLYANAFGDTLDQGTIDPPDQKTGRALMVEALEKDFQDATLSERRAQASALARLGDQGALLRLATAALATDEVPADSRRAAIESLSRFKLGEPVEGALASLIRDALLGDCAAITLAHLRGETFFEPSWRERLAPAVPYR
jgi:HEAT repeat protein